MSILPIIHRINPALGRDGFTGWRGAWPDGVQGVLFFMIEQKILKINEIQ